MRASRLPDLAALLASARAYNRATRSAAATVGAVRRRMTQAGTLPGPLLRTRFRGERLERVTLADSESSSPQLALELEMPFPGTLGLLEPIVHPEAERR